MIFLSINTIDKITHVCYTQDKLENKIKILTNNKKNQQKQKENKMTETIKLPTKVINSDWKDDTVDYETYGTPKQEMEYISPDTISKESIERIKARRLNHTRGHNVLSIFSKNEKIAA